MHTLQQPTTEQWFLNNVEIALESSIRLTGNYSLYDEYGDFCKRNHIPPLGVKNFSKTVEILVARHFHILSVKTRD